MGEIKSTLDLVMEKTRHLSLSEKEKQEQQRRELSKMARGLVSKVIDGKTTVDQLRMEIETQRATRSENIDPVFIRAICDALNLGGDNTLPVSLLTGIFGLDTQHVSALLTAYQEAAVTLSQNRAGEIKKNLEDQHAIGGSSVTPNLNRDALAKKEGSDLMQKYDQKLQAACDKLKPKSD